MKSNLSYILFFLSLFFSQLSPAQELKRKGISNQKITSEETSTTKKDSLKKPGNYLPKKKRDTILSDSTQKIKESLKDIVTHNAEDYTVINSKNRTITLYNKGEVNYGDINLKAGKIIINYKNNTVFAKGIKDSTGIKYTQRPQFKQGDQETEQDSILFNFKTRKALIYGVKTVQGEMIALGEKTKRVNDSTVYMRKIRFTTSKKEIPDYYIATNKAKLVPGKKIIVGTSQLYIADVPTPLYLPFAYYPITDERASGFIIPSWGDNDQQGFFLQNGGYYFALNDYFDLKITGDLYTNGSWGLNSASNYNVRYKFSGSFGFSYQNSINSIKGFSDYRKTSNYNITWSHRQDSKSNPNSNLSASVNLGSSKFYQESINQKDASNYLDNSLNSSINYSKKFIGTPLKMNLTMRHSQSSKTKEINMTLPSLQINMDRLYPFAGKGDVKNNAFQKISLDYNVKGDYRIKTTDEDFFTSKMFLNAKKGLNHSISTSTSMKAFKYFTVSPSMNYKDVWYFDHLTKYYNPNKIHKNGNLGATEQYTSKKFTRFNEYNVSVNIATSRYGTFNINKGRLKAIRHTVRPSVSWSYRPDFAEMHNLQVQQSVDNTDISTYTPFDEGIYGKPSGGLSNSISIGIANVFEAKVAPKDPDSDEEDKKITLLRNLDFSSSYNIAADSVRWSDVRFATGTSLFKNKLSINLSGSLTPYQVTEKGAKTNTFNKNILRLRSTNLTANYSISSKDFDKDSKKNNTESSQETPDVYGTKINPTNRLDNKLPNQILADKTKAKQENKEKQTLLYNAKIPWNINFAYSANYNNDGYKTDEITNHTVGFSGNLELTPKWKIGFASGYDIKGKDFSYTRLNFSRDLDSWRFNFNWIPFGDRTSYNFFIGVKSTMLSDLKWDKVKPPDKRLF